MFPRSSNYEIEVIIRYREIIDETSTLLWNGFCVNGVYFTTNEICSNEAFTEDNPKALNNTRS